MTIAIVSLLCVAIIFQVGEISDLKAHNRYLRDQIRRMMIEDDGPSDDPDDGIPLPIKLVEAENDDDARKGGVGTGGLYRDSNGVLRVVIAA